MTCTRLLKNKGKPYMRGEDVKAVQEALKKAKFSPGTIDGIYGPKTEKAIRAYQKKMKLAVDGIVGPKTWAALFTAPPETAHFKAKEFKCKDGTAVPLEYYGNLKKLMDMLETIRTAAGDKPMKIVSGYRTVKYNAKVGGAKSSQHLYASAADVRTPKGITYTEFYKLCDKLNPKGGVGNYPNRFVHVDVRGNRSRW